MRSARIFGSAVLTCVLTLSFGGLVQVADAASKRSVLKRGENAKHHVVKVKRRNQVRRLYLPIAPYIAYDYPYYYSRGHYPTHIGPGYIYPGFLYYSNGRGHR